MSVVKDVMDLVLELEKRQKSRADVELISSIRNALNEVEKENIKIYNENLSFQVKFEKSDFEHVKEVDRLTLAHGEEISRLNEELSEIKAKSNNKPVYSSVMGR